MKPEGRFLDAPWKPSSLFERWAARLFGTKYVTEDSGCRLTFYRWRGDLYLAKVE